MVKIDKIVRISEKGQITLPIAWRRAIKTNVVRTTLGKNNSLIITPVYLK